jgi:hypothetical protein
MKKLILSAIIFFMCAGAFAQARTATAEFNKTMQPAMEIEIPFQEKTVEKSLTERMEKKGYKGKDSKGYSIYRGVNLPEIGPDSYDLYFKTDRKSRKEKDITILTMLVSKGAQGSEVFLNETDNADVLDKVKAFLNAHVDIATAYDLELQIKDQQEATEKADKKYRNLVEDGEDLVKKKERLEKDMAENTKKQADQKAEAEKQRQILTTLMAKRKQ